MSLSLILLISCCFYLAIGVPVAFALGFSTLTTLIFGADFPLFVLLKQTYEGVDSFPLMAVPFFILAAELMSGGSLTEVLLKFAAQFVGHKRGGLGYTNVASLTFFSGISGSALADAAGPGSMMIRMMDKAGYDRSYAAALTAATAIVGPIIPLHHHDHLCTARRSCVGWCVICRRLYPWHFDCSRHGGRQLVHL